MRVALRADAGPERGTGHVMRCLTVAEALVQLGHDVLLLGVVESVPWLTDYIRTTDVTHVSCGRDSLDLELLQELRIDRVVVDSYWIAPDLISRVNREIPTLAIVDGDARGIRADFLLDHNVGAETRDWSEAPGTVLAGSKYALVRQAIRGQRVDHGWEVPGRESHIVAFMGGTDPGAMMQHVVASIVDVLPQARLTAITTQDLVPIVRRLTDQMPNGVTLGPTPDLPRHLGDAHLIVSAAGTSVLDVCTIGKPTVLVGVVDNQSEGLRHAVDRGLALGVDATTEGASSVGSLVLQLLDDADLRERLVRTATTELDGMGSSRVAEALTAV
jgi:spore coat polysaccharide biosynthesis predicted glycosyltransferase SpsG